MDPKQLGELVRLSDEKILLFRNIDSFSPDDMSREVVELSSLWASWQTALALFEDSYNKLMKDLVEKYETVAKANVYGKASEEYRMLRKAEGYSKSVQQMIRSGNRNIDLAKEMKRESRY